MWIQQHCHVELKQPLQTAAAPAFLHLLQHRARFCFAVFPSKEAVPFAKCTDVINTDNRDEAHQFSVSMGHFRQHNTNTHTQTHGARVALHLPTEDPAE